MKAGRAIVRLLALVPILLLSASCDDSENKHGGACRSGAPLSIAAEQVPLGDAKESLLGLISAGLRPTRVNSPPTRLVGGSTEMYAFADTDVRIRFEDDGTRITRLVVLTSTVTELELDRLTRAAALLVSGYSGSPEPDVRKSIGEAIVGRRPGMKLIALKMFGTLGLVLSAPNDDVVVASIERQKCA